MNLDELVVGQKVWMRSGGELKEVTVSAIYEEMDLPVIYFTGAIIEVVVWHEVPICGQKGFGIIFDKSGKQRGVVRLVDAWDPRPLCGSSGLPWELVGSKRPRNWLEVLTLR